MDLRDQFAMAALQGLLANLGMKTGNADFVIAEATYRFADAMIAEREKDDVELVSASHLAQKYNLSVTTIREKLAPINQGTQGKALYNPRLAHDLLTVKVKRGRPRAN